MRRRTLSHTERKKSAHPATSLPSDDNDSSVEDNEDNPLPVVGDDGPPIRVRDVFNGLFHPHDHHSDSVSVEVEHYIHDKTFRQRMILLSLNNSKLGIRLHYIRSILFLIGCLLYVAEVVYYDHLSTDKIGVDLSKDCNYNKADGDVNDVNVSSWTCGLLQLKALAIVGSKPYPLWFLQVGLSMCVLILTAVGIYVMTELSCRGIIKALDFSLIIMISIPVLYLVTLIYPPFLKNLFVPSFLYCWPAGQSLTTAVVQSLQRNAFKVPNNFRVEGVRLAIFLGCFVFTWVSVIHHMFRNDIKLDYFNTMWFIMVTMSTVGYGDSFPIAWPGKLLVILFIIAAILYLIPRLEELYEAFRTQQMLNNSVSMKQSGEKFILICSTNLKPIVLRDFLTEFYSDPTHYEVHSVVMVEKELGSISQMYLSHPIWTRRITVLIGTPLRLADLRRARASNAMACFIHTYRGGNHDDADRHTIMCAWSLKDYAPRCKLYVQILKPENRLHLSLADQVVVDGELKHAILANNSHCPGISTLVTLLLHTFKREKNKSSRQDAKLYSQCAACEVYDSLLGDSLYFHHFVGKNFLYAAVVAFRKYSVTLIGVRAAGTTDLMLNPGVDHILSASDSVYYIAYASEEHSKLRGPVQRHTLWHACANFAVIALGTTGINPYRVEQVREVNRTAPRHVPGEESEGHNKAKDCCKPDKFFCPDEDREVCTFKCVDNKVVSDSGLADPAIVVGKTPDIVGVEEGEGKVTLPLNDGLDDQQMYDMMRGVRLLRFHSLAEPPSMGFPLKVNLLRRDANLNWPPPPPPPPPPVVSKSFSSPLSSQSHHLPSILKRKQGARAHAEKDATTFSVARSPILSGKGHKRTKSSGCKGVASLYDLVEETVLEGEDLYAKEAEVCDSHHHVAISLEEDVEEMRIGRSRSGTAFSDSSRLKPALPKTKVVLKQMSEPGSLFWNRDNSKHMMNFPLSTLEPPPIFQDSGITRWASEGKLKEEKRSVGEYQILPNLGLGVEGMGREVGGFYTSEKCLLTPTSGSKHVSLNPFSDMYLRQSKTLFSSSHRMSQHGIDRGGSNNGSVPETNGTDVFEIELDDMAEQNELVNIEDGCCESTSASEDEESSGSSRASASDGSCYDESEKEEMLVAEEEEEVDAVDGVHESTPIPILDQHHFVGHHHGHHANHHHYHNHHHHHHHHHHHSRPQYEKGTLPFPPHIGFEFLKVHLLLQQRTKNKVQLIPSDTEVGEISMREEMAEHSSHVGCVIVYCQDTSDDLYHFILPMRAHYLHASLLNPLVIMVDKEPEDNFVETIAWLPLVYYMVGKLSNINHWLKAGILLAESIVILCESRIPHGEDHQEHMVDASHIMAVQKLTTLFPSINIVTDIQYRFNIRFMQYAEKNVFQSGRKNLHRSLVRHGDHLMYLFMPPFAAGHAFCSSMLDTLLYQSYVKPYIIDLIRQLLGCKQVPGSGFLWKTNLTPELLQLQTYDRLFQRLVSTHKEIPLGIYRTTYIDNKNNESEADSAEEAYEKEEIRKFLSARLCSLGLHSETIFHTTRKSSNFQCYVLPNPPPKTELRPTDVILVLRNQHMPHSHHPPAAPHDQVSTEPDKPRKFTPSDHGSAKLSAKHTSTTETLHENMPSPSRRPPGIAKSVSSLDITPADHWAANERSPGHRGDGRRRRITIEGTPSSSTEKQTKSLSLHTCDQSGEAGREIKVCSKRSPPASLAEWSRTQCPLKTDLHDNKTGNVPGGHTLKAVSLSSDLNFSEEYCRLSLATPDFLVSQETTLLLSSASDNDDNFTEC